MDPINEAYQRDIREAMQVGRTSVRKFFKAFTGKDNWYKDWQTGNTMTLDGKHAQDVYSNSELVALMTVWNKYNMNIKVIKRDDEYEFMLGTVKVNVQATA